MRFTVGTADLRQALQAVRVHVGDDELPQIHRVRCDVGSENLAVSATNKHTLGHAVVSIEDNLDGEMGAFDLAPVDVKEILVLFHGKPGAGEDPGDLVRIEVDEKHLTVTDVSGLFEGKQLQLPRFPVEENYPDFMELLRETITKRRAAADRLIVTGEFQALFTTAAKVYQQPLVLDPAGSNGTMLITCGDSFIGLLSPFREDDARTAEIDGWHAAWLARIADRAPGLV